MKFFFKIITLFFFILFNHTVYANEKIAFINMNQILINSKAGKIATKDLQKNHKENNEKILKVEESLKKDEIDIISKKNILSKEEYEKKISDLRIKANDYRKKRSLLMNSLEEKRSKMTSNFLEEINPIIADYSAKNSISIIFEKKNILMGKTELDITDEILKLVDEKISKIKLE
jgi:outer membrane protein|tara:strand:- start:2251 stop:2775 length:525 start_codon:yes stop_codon:yes gene_type:complete